MAKYYCPYCSSLNNVAIVCNDNIIPKNSKYYSERCNQNKLKNNQAVLANWNLHYSRDYNGKVVKRRTYDRYCFNCHRPFYYISNLIINDIKDLTFIVETDVDRWKYDIHFSDTNSYYNIDHNYFTKEFESTLTPARKMKILKGIDTANLFEWETLKNGNRFDYIIKWNIYIIFNNEQTFARSGYDEYPKEWNKFIEPFIKVFKNNIFKKMKESINN